jgi:EthD domain-containing protein
MGAIKMVACVHRRSDLTLEEFAHYWREDHRALVLAKLPALQARRYAQNHLLPNELGPGLAAARGMDVDCYDGVLELWWDTLDDVLAAFSTAEALEASAVLAEDEARFIDLSRSKVFLTEELIMFDAGE